MELKISVSEALALIKETENVPAKPFDRTFCIKGIGNVEVRVPRDRDGDFQSQVLPRAQRYDGRITEDIAAMYLTGISTKNPLCLRSLSSCVCKNLSLFFAAPSDLVSQALS